MYIILPKNINLIKTINITEEPGPFANRNILLGGGGGHLYKHKIGQSGQHVQ